MTKITYDQVQTLLEWTDEVLDLIQTAVGENSPESSYTDDAKIAQAVFKVLMHGKYLDLPDRPESASGFTQGMH